jgi:SpoVK/Ycf46/Vps4 family AAA+-type ATPase
MTKRDPVRNEQQNYKKLKVKTKPIILENAPPLNSLPDLVKLSQSIILYKNIDSIMLWRLSPYITELNNLIGMTSLKETIFDQILYYLQGMHLRNDSQEYLHTMIFGSPGCGKTTVAKIIGKIYQSLGILSRNGNFKIAYRDDFIAGYLGQTAIKTKKLLNSCIGGVLFIDEVYALAPRDNDKDSFSKEALDILTAFLSEHKNDFCCIGAGYEQDVEECFFGMNKGLKRRFPWVHKIDTYSSEDMAQIFGKMVKEINWNVDFNNKTIVSIIEQNKKLFTNTGGDIETLLTKCKIAHSRRVIGLDIEKKHKNFEEKDTINPMYSIYI